MAESLRGVKVLLGRMRVCSGVAQANYHRRTSRPRLHGECLKIAGEILRWNVSRLEFVANKCRYVEASRICNHLWIEASRTEAAVSCRIGSCNSVTESYLVTALATT